ncbi:hypothetical protein TVAG_173810 [Trichomonas vaginalis G3]|uniref:Leucine Rich Repeat family protein n=1 Tax=Trichomonas vaginalis (strain ATCC PRA-98 / G3) TaxID=412133 RepID=A2EVK3_TRIV3|nr:ribonuclease inhibitor domain-containing protein [Trichomonas vaginalis G3]EAY03335.1 hypothetical protein TVAG_173810 [Trichomonas vaginalis G3]KAI5498316.1 ribonuclease inhibitor domain-containing protein [Trichomonas vaginalis G3]|eukprot:XP_001315558.1 hypothetical protein [Trichomonas vaginalis G3]
MSKLRSIIIPPSVKSIGERAFFGLSNLNTLKIYGNPTIGADSFNGTNIVCGITCYEDLVPSLISNGIKQKSFEICCRSIAQVRHPGFNFISLTLNAFVIIVM